MGAIIGRVATFLRDSWSHIDYVLNDISPFYLEKASDNMRYWERTAGRKKKALGSVHYVHARAEQLPLDDGSAELLFSDLFHYLPPRARRAVIDEAARILRPGDLFVIIDSIQLGNRPTRNSILTVFTNLNEPYYSNYIHEDFGEFVGKGRRLDPRQKELSSMSKMLSFVRI